MKVSPGRSTRTRQFTPWKKNSGVHLQWRSGKSSELIIHPVLLRRSRPSSLAGSEIYLPSMCRDSLPSAVITMQSQRKKERADLKYTGFTLQEHHESSTVPQRAACLTPRAHHVAISARIMCLRLVEGGGRLFACVFNRTTWLLDVWKKMLRRRTNQNACACWCMAY